MNIIEYIEENKNNTFEDKHFNDVDALILAQFSYSYIENFQRKWGKEFKIHMLDQEDIKNSAQFSLTEDEEEDFMNALKDSDRFKDLEIVDIEQAKECQFFAYTIRIDKHTLAVVYRGTDSSFDGWFESLSLAFDEEIPAQVKAKEYLKKIGDNFDDNIIVIGHSKGGNFAVFSSSLQDKTLQNRIELVYDFDGPGFLDEFYQRPDYSPINEKIRKFIPKKSLFGLLLRSDSKPIVISSEGLMVWQHSPFTWFIENYQILNDGKLTDLSLHTRNVAANLLKSYDKEERKAVLVALHDLFENIEADNVLDLFNHKLSSLFKIFKHMNNEDNENMQVLKDVASDLFHLIKDEAKIKL
ncbi:Mbeg1-like protein [uncultured Helcococcus sp.]|uniref:Mbeg1-like protein n=1 Tax=uncultured Helcococcus sp. TaxID=1072508 RepID=UPI002631D012|nr:Mbeg1-like protein [uncultured Helcococcus sp.]